MGERFLMDSFSVHGEGFFDVGRADEADKKVPSFDEIKKGIKVGDIVAIPIGFGTGEGKIVAMEMINLHLLNVQLGSS